MRIKSSGSEYHTDHWAAEMGWQSQLLCDSSACLFLLHWFLHLKEQVTCVNSLAATLNPIECRGQGIVLRRISGIKREGELCLRGTI